MLPEIEKVHKVLKFFLEEIFPVFCFYLDLWSFRNIIVWFTDAKLVCNLICREKKGCWKSSIDKHFFLIIAWLLMVLVLGVHFVIENLLPTHLVRATKFNPQWLDITLVLVVDLIPILESEMPVWFNIFSFKAFYFPNVSQTVLVL